MDKYVIYQQIAQVEIEAMEYQINALAHLARKTEFNPYIMDRIITLNQAAETDRRKPCFIKGNEKSEN